MYVVDGGILVSGVISWRPRGTTTRSEGWSLALIPPATQATCVANESTLCMLVDGASNSLKSWIPCIWLDKLWKLLHLHGLSGIRNMLSFLFYNLHYIYSLWSHLSWSHSLKMNQVKQGLVMCGDSTLLEPCQGETWKVKGWVFWGQDTGTKRETSWTR